MKLDTSWTLVFLALGISIIICLIEVFNKRKLSRKIIHTNLSNSLELVLGIYAISYSVFVIIFNIFGWNILFPQDSITLAIALLYGGFHIMLPKLTEFWKKTKPTKK